MIGMVKAELTVNDNKPGYEIEMAVSKTGHCPTDLLIGSDLMHQIGIEISYKNKTVTFDDSSVIFIITVIEETINDDNSVSEKSEDNSDSDSENEAKIEEVSDSEAKIEEITDSEQETEFKSKNDDSNQKVQNNNKTDTDQSEKSDEEWTAEELEDSKAWEEASNEVVSNLVEMLQCVSY
uniref:Uncharacterized protein n=1 Tax=Panagrolaimus sp. JU765 TaxID=591449 RepID=A0AC34RBT7_9BILA